MGSVSEPTRSLRSNTTIPSDPPSAQMLFNHIRKVILDQNRPADLSFPNIPSSAGLQLATSFSEDPEIEKTLPRISYNSLTQILTARVRPTNVHDCHQEWLDDEIYLMTRAGFLTHLEKRSLRMRVGTSYQGFAPPYTSSSKQPDTCIVPDDLRLPTVVIETGWTESWPRLNADKDLWLVGGGGSVELVLLIRWSKLVGNKVKGEIQAHGRNAAGNIVLLQTEAIFPAPPGNANQVIPISRGQIFGSYLLPGRNAGDIYNLSIANFREWADGPIRSMGFIPA